MAQKTIITLTSDISGRDADETVQFGLDNARYEIDLTTKEARKLRDAMAPFVAGARRIRGARKTTRRRATSTATKQPTQGGQTTAAERAAIRAWAGKNGHQVGEKGRIPQAVLDAYYAAK